MAAPTRVARIAVGRTGAVQNATVEKNVTRMLLWLGKAAAANADLVLLHETVSDCGTAIEAESIPGPTNAD